jgi:Ulp1 family protease
MAKKFKLSEKDKNLAKQTARQLTDENKDQSDIIVIQDCLGRAITQLLTVKDYLPKVERFLQSDMIKTLQKIDVEELRRINQFAKEAWQGHINNLVGKEKYKL